MKREAWACAVLALQLTAACNPASETPALQPAISTGSAGRGVGPASGSLAGAGARPASAGSGVATASGSAGAAAFGAASPGRQASQAAAGAAGGAAAAGGIGSIVGVGGRPAVPASSSAAGSGAAVARVPALRSAGCGKPNMMTGLHQGTIRAFDLDRGYYASVPKDYDPERAYRLVFGFHGSGYTGKMMRQYLDNEKAPLLDGTIFVYPDGLPLSDDDPMNTAWELKANGRDSAFFDALLDQLRNTYCIDETRIFVNGQSFGALMTNFIGCLRGDMIRAIAVVAGSGPYGSMCAGKVSVWMTHGMDDDSVPFKSGEMSRDFWLKQNGCSTMTVPGTPMQCQVYQGCDPENGVIWCPHNMDGGHQHPSFGRAAVRDFFASF